MWFRIVHNQVEARWQAKRQTLNMELLAYKLATVGPMCSHYCLIINEGTKWACSNKIQIPHTGQEVDVRVSQWINLVYFRENIFQPMISKTTNLCFFVTIYCITRDSILSNVKCTEHNFWLTQSTTEHSIAFCLILCCWSLRPIYCKIFVILQIIWYDFIVIWNPIFLQEEDQLGVSTNQLKGMQK